jgi:hypothetical protein
MDKRAFLVGILVALGLLGGVVSWKWGNAIRAASLRGPVPGLEDEAFWPPADPRADAVLAAARSLLERWAAPPVAVAAGGSASPAAETAPAADLEPDEAALRARWPALAEFGDGSLWYLALYLPRPGDAGGPFVASLSGGVLAAARALWDRMPVSAHDAAGVASARLKVDVVLPGRREFPYDGGSKGVALDEGIDGVVLEHPDRGVFHYLPSWSIEREISRADVHGRARRRAREWGDWPKADTQEAGFSAIRTRAWIEAVPAGGPALPSVRANVDLPEITPELLRDRIALAAGYLVRETDGEGSITYEYQADEDKTGDDYNMLRHAGTAYSMAQAYRLLGDPAILEATKRAYGYYVKKMKEDRRHPGEWFVLDGRRAKLGGAGLGLCMMVEMEKAAPGSVDRELMMGLARHIERMQLPNGDFDSFYDWDGKGVSEHRSTFYPGEAILGLVRLYQLTGDEHWLDVAEKGADYMVGPRWVSLGIRFYTPPDAWLIQALEEMDRVRPDGARTEQAFRIAEVIAGNKLMDPERTPPDMLGADLSGLGGLPNAATAGSYGEALAAAARLEARRRPGEERHRTFAMRNASFQLRNQFTTLNSYYLPNPARALGGFRLKPDDAEIRNDYVQHNLSGLFGLLDLLDESAPDVGGPRRAAAPASPAPPAPGMTEAEAAAPVAPALRASP